MLNKIKLIVWFLPVFYALSGCAPITVYRDAENSMPVQLRVDDAAYWLEEWRRNIQLPAEQYQQVVTAREADFTQQPNVRNRLRLALLLAEGKPSGLDRARALKLVRGLEVESASDSARALALLIETSITERVKLAQKKAKKSGAAKKPSQKQGGVEKNYKEELSVAKSRIKELEQQLHELTSIEQNIQERTKR